MKNALLRPFCAACLAASLTIVGCSPATTTTITNDPVEPDAATSITPLERGEIRRYAETSAQDAVDAWVSGDRDSFTAHFGDLPQQLMFTRWDEADAAGETIDRIHELIALDVYEMNPTGTQALAKYRFYDNTVVTDAAGEIVEAGAGIEAEFQFTMEPLEAGSDEWIVVRMIGNTESIR